MGKIKHHKPQVRKHTTNNGKSNGKDITRRQHSQGGKSKSTPTTNNHSTQSSRLRIPFAKHDRILLVGEGDFSFALSLATYHDVGAIVATSYDDEATLHDKHPQIDATLQRLLNSRDFTKIDGDSGDDSEGEWQGFSPQPGDQLSSSSGAIQSSQISQVTIMHGIDAKSLHKSHRKVLAKHAPFTKVVFNFPHIGGVSTDVNRQVRANQELLVAFLDSVKSVLATNKTPAETSPHNVQADHMEEHDSDEAQQSSELLKIGNVLVTLFEGEPYTLWNIRDLARHSGFQVEESFRFPWSAYPGYTHARTMGNITSGKDRSDEGTRKGAWRGEEREARCYVLGLKEEGSRTVNPRRKYKHDDSDDSTRIL